MNAHQYTEALEEFSIKLFKECINIKSMQKDSIVLSAFSAKMLMSMVAMGAQGRTKEELCSALCIKDMDKAVSAVKEIMNELNDTKGVSLTLANKIFVRQGKPCVSSDSVVPINKESCAIFPTYRAIVEDVFKSEIEEIHFKAAHEAAAKINSWVCLKTCGAIKAIIAPHMISPNTRAVLINTIYFKGLWANSFERNLTRKKAFYLLNGDVVKVEMMFLSSKLYYTNVPELDVQMVSLPYKNENLSMVIVLPNSSPGFEDIKRIVAGNVMHYMRNATLEKVKLQLPKFKTETDINLTQVFKNLGVNSLFSAEARLGGISADRNLSITDIIQKACIEVNEEGSKAAVCTYSIVFDSPMGDGSKYFTVDRPFYYEIVYNRRPLFSGIFRGP